MKVTLDNFEQSIEDNADSYISLSTAERNEVELIINAVNKTKNANIS